MGMVIGVKPDQIAEYKRIHAAVWPEILDEITDCNIRNYTIFLREPENLLFAYCKYHGDDWAADAAKMKADRRTQAGGLSPSRCRRRLPTARKANGGRWPRTCFIMTEGEQTTFVDRRLDVPTQADDPLQGLQRPACATWTRKGGRFVSVIEPMRMSRSIFGSSERRMWASSAVIAAPLSPASKRS